MAFDPTLASTRDKLRAILGDTEDPPGFEFLNPQAAPLLPDLTEAAYDALITTYGAQKAGVILCGRVRRALPGKYTDGDASEDLTATLDAFKELEKQLNSGDISVEGVGGAGVVVAGISKFLLPDMTEFNAL